MFEMCCEYLSVRCIWLYGNAFKCTVHISTHNRILFENYNAFIAITKMKEIFIFYFTSLGQKNVQI